MTTGPDFHWLFCTRHLFGICFVPPANESASSIFGFSEFISALALLAIVYTVSDVRYRFRVAVAPWPLFRLTYCLIAFIGAATLLTEVWVREKWLVPDIWVTKSIWQGCLGTLFLILVLTWMWYAFIKIGSIGCFHCNYRLTGVHPFS